MSNYTKATNFASKDALLTGNPSKIVKGTEIDNEFNAISTAVSTKFDTASLAAPGPIGATTPAAITGTNIQATSYNGGQLAGLRNKIINGNMGIAQRGAAGTSANTYSLDRWLSFYAGTATTWNHTVGGSLLGQYFPYLLAISGAAGNTVATVAQRIESANSADLCSKTVTLSAYILQNSGSTKDFVIQVQRPNTKDNWAGVTTVATSGGLTVLNSTWTRIVFTTTLPASGPELGLSFEIVLGAIAAGQTYYITGAQLEIGSVATPFEQRPIGMELALCQRYYQLLLNGGIGTNNAATVISRVTWPLFVAMRSAPTIAFFSGSPAFFQGANTANYSSIGSTYITTTTAQADINVTGGAATAGLASIQKAESGVFSASAEL